MGRLVGKDDLDLAVVASLSHLILLPAKTSVTWVTGNRWPPCCAVPRPSYHKRFAQSPQINTSLLGVLRRMGKPEGARRPERRIVSLSLKRSVRWLARAHVDGRDSDTDWGWNVVSAIA